MAPHPAIPTRGMRHDFSPQEPIQLLKSPYTVGGQHPTSNAISCTLSTFFANSVLLMLLFTRRWLGPYLSLGSVGWLWHRNMASLDSPDEYTGMLSAWNAAMCKGIGICGGVSGNNLGAGEKDKMVVQDERPTVPNFVIDHGRLSLLCS